MEKLNKVDAAAFLGCTTRTLTNHVNAGRLNPTYDKGKTSPVAMFDVAELEQVKAQSGKSAKVEIVEVGKSKDGKTEDGNRVGNGKAGNKENPNMETALAISSFPTSPPPSNVDGLELLTQAFKAANESLPTSIAAKHLITIPEAMLLSGVKEKPLRDAIKAEKLKSVRVGRAIQVRPEDLKKWVDTLFG